MCETLEININVRISIIREHEIIFSRDSILISYDSSTRVFEHRVIWPVRLRSPLPISRSVIVWYILVDVWASSKYRLATKRRKRLIR